MSADSSERGRRTSVLVVDDEKSLRFTLCEALKDEGFDPYPAANGQEAFALLREQEIDLVLLDLRLKESGEDGLTLLKAIRKDYPWIEVVMMTAYGKFDDAVEATKNGCYQFMAKPFQLDQLKVVLRGALEHQSLRREVEVLRRASSRSRYTTDMTIGQSAPFTEVLETVGKIAPSRATVLLLGETGTGKEVIARAVHRGSLVASGPMVEINCSAVPENLLESELFGHEKGAFTDAKERKKGVFELADRGTLFLDEIGDMHPNLQAKLLRVLETGRFKRVGGTSNIEVEVRVVAATHRDLLAAVKAGTFRQDLYYRLAVVPIVLPALRERDEDILLLARFFLDHLSRELGRTFDGFTPEAERLLMEYSWPGNVRELRNVVERAALLAPGARIDALGLPIDTTRSATGGEPGDGPRPGTVWTLADAEKMAIARALEQFAGNKTRAAEALGISRGTLRAKVKEYHLVGGDEGDGED